MEFEGKRPTTVRTAPSENHARAPATVLGSPGSEARARPARVASALAHALLVAAGIGVLLAGSPLLAALWCVACRCAYVGFVGLALRAHTRAPRPAGEPDVLWRRFKARASPLMLGDSVALVVLCLVTRGSLSLPGPTWPAWIAGGLLVVLGVGVKAWASASLPEGTFYWRDFFVPVEQRELSKRGPYRWLSNPMYGLGYAHAYGFALLVGSLPGLFAAAFAQAAILGLAVLVERPHVLGPRGS
jgi:protein-S-isoprenylcysteine O-methyltransferase Ste14